MFSKRTDRSGLNAIILIVALMLFAGVGFYIGKTQTRPSVVVVLTNGESRTLTRANAQGIIDEQQLVSSLYMVRTMLRAAEQTNDIVDQETAGYPESMKRLAKMGNNQMLKGLLSLESELAEAAE